MIYGKAIKSIPMHNTRKKKEILHGVKNNKIKRIWSERKEAFSSLVQKIILIFKARLD